MINYEFKAYVLQEYADVVAFQRKFSRYTYLLEYADGEYSPTLSSQFESYVTDDEFAPVYAEATRINLAYYARVKRLKDRISTLLRLGTCFFLTLTFNDSVLASTSADTRRKYVTLFLKSLSTDYVANIDFGSQNGREHYHAVVLSDSPIMTPWDCYGFSNAKKIGSSEDFTPIAKYISKLANHAVKATTKGSRAIYSR